MAITIQPSFSFMSSVLPCHAYRNASDLPPEFWGALGKNEAAANLILPFAKKALASPLKAGDDQLWIILYDPTGKDVEFVLSCTRGLLGNYPIFIFTPKSSVQLAKDEAEGKDIPNYLSQLTIRLLNEVPSHRVFSVFSVAYVAEQFSLALQEHDIQPLNEPYYDAIFTFCTAETLSRFPESFALKSEDLEISLCLANMESHLEAIKGLCQGFSYTSPPYILEDARAEIEARELIANKQVWVHLIKEADKEWEVACLVATTRQSENVTAVTKVFTAEKWRNRGCAGRLLYRVCDEILREKKKRVVLYVGSGDELASARKAYRKVGFQGLDPQQKENVESVERWVEIGFKDTTLGYW